MKRRFSRIIKDSTIVLSLVLFVGVIGFSAKNELGFLLGHVSQLSSPIAQETIAIDPMEDTIIIEPDPIPLGSADTIIPTGTPTPPPAIPAPTPPPAPAIPNQLIIPAINIDQAITEYTNDMVAERGGINPEGWFTVAWWSGAGFPNASPDNSPVLTTLLYGHSTNEPNNKIIFDDIGLLTTGDAITIKTDQGYYQYAVESVFTVPKADLTSDPRATQNTAGRLLLTSCWGEPPNIGATATHNIVVVAQQIPTPPPK